MARIFDYKFVIILGLSLIVYFLYREVEQLNKRVCALESNDIEQLDQCEQPKIDMEVVVINKDNMVEEYSNDTHTTSTSNTNIYSHDILNTNTNDIESVGIESIINMVKDEPVQLVAQESMPTELNNEKTTNDVIDEIISISKSPSPSPKEDDIILGTNENNLENLMKLKLSELQYMATNMGINLNVENGKKKKTKTELANEILNKK